MPDYLETTADKFIFRVASDRHYTAQGVWARPESNASLVRVGLADYPQQHHGDVAFAQVRPVGTRLSFGDPFAQVETIKTMLELASPVSGSIVEVNILLQAAPELVNQSPYETGWLALIAPADWEVERSKLLDAAAYFAVMNAQLREDMKNL